MKIKKIYLFILLIVAVFMLIYSCGSRFNPRYYYNKNLSAGYIGGGDLPDDFEPEEPGDTNQNGDTNQGGNTNSGGSTITNRDRKSVV